MFRLSRATFVAAALPIFALVSACTSKSDNTGRASAADSSAARSAIDSLNAQQMKALNAMDTVHAVANYAPDAILMYPNAPVWRGQDAIKKGFADLFQSMTIKVFTSKTDDLVVSGNLAVENGSYAMDVQPKTGPEMKDQGKYVTVWQKQPNGAWKIIRDINNSSLPASNSAPSAPAAPTRNSKPAKA